MFANAKQTREQLEGADVIVIIGANNLAPLVYTGERMIPEARGSFRSTRTRASLAKTTRLKSRYWRTLARRSKS